MDITVSCQQCSSKMEQTDKTERSLGLQIIGVPLFLLGLILLFVFPIGTILGIPIMIVATRLGHKSKKIWKCLECGYFFEREK